MPSHPDRVRRNYKCIFCKGTGWVLLTNANDANDIQPFTCGMCKGRGTTITTQMVKIESITGPAWDKRTVDFSGLKTNIKNLLN